ncbi:MAG: hypothetical protein KDK26_13955 [Roseivivax sp.]|nr:hypothetical protein [Roseivivax sp.]
MPLHILGPLVVIGIAGIVVLVHLLRLSAPSRFDTEETARRAWLREFPGTAVRKVRLSQAGDAALVETESGAGLVWAFGADTVARPLAGAKADAGPRGLTLRLPDYTAPRIHLPMPPEEAARWRARIEETR